MYYQQNLRVQLQQRRNRLYKAVMDTYQNELKYLLEFIKRSPYLDGLVQALAVQHPDINWPQWKSEHFHPNRTFELPDSETAAAKVCYGMICECAETKEASWQYGLYAKHGENNVGSLLRSFTEVFVDPFINYLHDKIDRGNNVLYLLEKYKRRVEWFHRNELLTRIENDSRHSETVPDNDLREYLFDQGIEYPFSSPLSPSGRADLLADTGEQRPLVLEIKLFEPARGYDKAYVRKGFRQIYDYCGDYNQEVGFLVIFNCSDFTLLFKTSNDKGWPPRVEVDHRTFFLVVIDLKQPEQAASKRGPLNPYEIDQIYLTSEAND
jgi:hypothetical protein